VSAGLPEHRAGQGVFVFQFMDKQMTQHPGDIVAADQLRRIGKLVEGVDIE